MGVAHLAKAVAIGQIGDGVELLVSDVARGHAGTLERQRHGGVAGLLVRHHVALAPAAETGMFGVQLGERGVLILQSLVLRIDEELADTLNFSFGQRRRAVLQVRPFGLDALGEYFWRQRLDQDLDARLELVVAAAVSVVDPQDRIEVAQQVLPRQEFVDEAADDRRPAKAATDRNAEAQLARIVLHRFQADIVHLDRSAIAHCAVDGDLELARQEGEFGMEGGPLADDFAPGPRVDQLITSHASELVGGGVADAVAAGLDGVHLHGGQLGEDLGYVFQFRPIELHVGPGADMGITLVVATGDLGQLAHLRRGKQTVRHGDAQHRRIALDVQAVLQAQWAELLISEFASQEAAGLVAELPDPILDDVLVVLIVNVHKCPVFRLLQLSRARPRTHLGRAARYQLVVMRKSDVWEYV